MRQGWQWVAIAVSLLAWFGLLLQLWLLLGRFMADGSGVLNGLWRYFSFFTILSNIAAATVSSRAVMIGADLPSARTSRVELAAISSIAMVGITYGLLLRGLIKLEGWHLVADHLLHDLNPLLFVLFWLLRPRADLTWRDAFWALPMPSLYCIYALSRGPIDGFYAYFFLNPQHMTIAQLAGSIAAFAVAFLAMGFLLVLFDRFRSAPKIRAA
jgi:hypothetical protein